MEIQGYPNYLIYEDGRVYNKKSNRFRKHHVKKDGYLSVDLWNKGKTNTFYIHRLIALHYIPNPENKEFIDHIDRNRGNNDISNLRWVTHTENMNNRIYTTKPKSNTSGHMKIHYNKARDIWIYQNKAINKYKSFKSKIDAICFKFIYILKNKSKQ